MKSPILKPLPLTISLLLLLAFIACTPARASNEIRPAETALNKNPSASTSVLPRPIPQADTHANPSSATLEKEPSASISVLPRPTFESQIIGHSTQGRPIEAFQFGDGPRHLVLIGGIHGGSEWNTILLAYEAVDYFTAHPEALPANASLTVIPAANPDGLVRALGQAGRFSAADARRANAGALGAGRFNSRDVDLNRNWACSWKRVGYWGEREVSGGVVPFSEAETRALGAFLTTPPVDGVIFWHSAAVGVYAGGCNGRSDGSDALSHAYADGSGYPFQLAFSYYPITGDATDWLASKGIPAAVVELNDRTHTEWERNLAGIQAVLADMAGTAEIGR